MFFCFFSCLPVFLHVILFTWFQYTCSICLIVFFLLVSFLICKLLCSCGEIVLVLRSYLCRPWCNRNFAVRCIVKDSKESDISYHFFCYQKGKTKECMVMNAFFRFFKACIRLKVIYVRLQKDLRNATKVFFS